MAQFPYLQRKKLYPTTKASEPIVYYPKTISLASHCGHCAGCGKKPVRVDSYFHFELCASCDASAVAQGIHDHVFEVTTQKEADELFKHLTNKKP